LTESDGFALANHSFELRYTQTSPTPEDFNFIKSLAGGAFGQVFLAMKKKTKDYFAIKVDIIKNFKATNNTLGTKEESPVSEK
jgi:hypothetical protein